MAEYSPTDCSTAVRSAVVFSLSQHFAQQLFLCRLDMQSTVAFDWIHCSSRLLVVQSLVEKLATGFPNDWLDQTMSYQLIQTTSFAMHPRMFEYNVVALDWMYKPPAEQSAESYKGKMLSYQLMQTTSFCNRQLQTPTAGCTTTGYFLYDVASSLALLFITADSSSSTADCEVTADSSMYADVITADTSSFFFDLFLQQTSQFPFQLVQLGLRLISNT
ncbi:hypothetical protein F511_31120 [Dorcoceras hygrometricum]|uniref:Uncharacterized protein n=1 Tax=Dorcoceras hygrometricum TaxID=472368 RepID=A0A2Z7AFT3_9LAMI|nr:hypothetical protein F511_31120 [Dorcoceras hygrometricum]